MGTVADTNASVMGLRLGILAVRPIRAHRVSYDTHCYRLVSFMDESIRLRTLSSSSDLAINIHDECVTFYHFHSRYCGRQRIAVQPTDSTLKSILSLDIAPGSLCEDTVVHAKVSIADDIIAGSTRAPVSASTSVRGIGLDGTRTIAGSPRP